MEGKPESNFRMSASLLKEDRITWLGSMPFPNQLIVEIIFEEI